MIIRNLNYNLFQDGELDLSIRCANATLSNPGSEVVLRGCVVITTGDGSKLMSNCVQWDLEGGHFTIPGTYVLDRHGSLVRGRAIRCDGHLEPVRASKLQDAGPKPVYRFYAAANGSHFYTINTQEMRRLTDQYSDLWTYEGIAYHAFLPDQRPAGTRPVYLLRFLGRNTYFLTLDESEKDRLLGDGRGLWQCDGVAFYAYPADRRPSNTQPVYRFWSDHSQSPLYTASEDEKNKLVCQSSPVWTWEGIAWYAPTGSPEHGRLARGQDR